MKAKTFQHFGAVSFWLLLAVCLLVPAAGAQQFSVLSSPTRTGSEALHNSFSSCSTTRRTSDLTFAECGR